MFSSKMYVLEGVQWRNSLIMRIVQVNGKNVVYYMSLNPR